MKLNNIFSFKTAVGAVGLALLSLTVTSCDKEVTDLQPFDRITETLAFETKERCELSMVGVYDAAQSGFYAGGQVRGYPFGAANTEQGDNRGEDVINVAAFFAITYEATYNPTTANNVYHWHTLYGTINKANIIIEGVNKALANGVLTAEEAGAYEGEARFLRALCHHELLVHFARPYAHTADASHYGIPYRTVAINTASSLDTEINKGRNSVAECYNLLIEDLNYAETNLPATRNANHKITRATKGAAIALKSRVYLHKGDWANTITESNKLIGGSSYALEASVEGPFANNGGNTESIFSIENSSIDHPGVNGALPSMYAVAPGRSLISISPILYNAPWWLASDKRRELLVKQSNPGFNTHKYRDVVNNTDYNPIIRLSEVILNAAEATARQNNISGAVDLLNMVRNRAVTNAADQFTAGSFTSSDDAIEAIIRERRIEFLCEGRRWSDIHRLALDPVHNIGGIPAKVHFGNVKQESWGIGVDYTGDEYTGTKSVAAVPYDNYRFVWPIPVEEILTNPVLAAQQNPGY